MSYSRCYKGKKDINNLFFIYLIFILFFQFFLIKPIDAQIWDHNYEKRAQELIATLTKLNGLSGFSHNQPALWPVLKKNDHRFYQAEKMQRGVSWQQEDKTAYLNALFLTNLELHRAADFSGLAFLNYLEIYGNQLRSINIDGNFKLKELNAMKNQIGRINLISCPDLRYISLSNNRLEQIDISQNHALKELFLSNNLLSELDSKANPELSNLEIMNNNLTEIDISKNPLLNRLLLSYNQLKKIDLSHNIYLRELGIKDNKLSEIDLSANKNLTNLALSRNELKEIKLENLPELTRLSAEENLLEKIKLDNCYKLESIELYSNPLDKLEFGNNPLSSLEYINLDNCRLPLSALLFISGKAKKRARFGQQNNVLFEELEIKVNQKLDFSSEAELGGKASKFIVLTEKKRRLNSNNYSEEKGVFSFKAPGRYYIEMTNENVYSSEINPLSGRVRKFKVKATSGLIIVGFAANE